MSNSWLVKAESFLPPEKEVTARNRAISAQYAALYLDNPAIFKWAGMAAFASDHIGFVLKPFNLKDFDILDSKEACLDENIGLKNDVQLVRHINNRIYKDIAWAHMAYLEEGIEVLRKQFSDLPAYDSMLKGFELMEEGQTQSDEQKIWEGNLLLLEHEQLHVVQSFFDQLSVTFKSAMSFTATLDFTAADKANDLKLLSGFYFFMIFRCWRLLISTRSLPDITNFSHRWRWISKSLFPKWKAQEFRDASVKERLIQIQNSNRITV